MATVAYDVFLSGKARFFNAEVLDKYGFWSVVLYFDENSDAYNQIVDLKKKGIKNELKRDEDGYYMRFKRPPFIKSRTKGDIPLAPPPVFEKDGKTAFRGLIGPGSDVTLKINIYPYKGGTGGWASRWESTRLDNLVPFKTTDFPPAVQRQAEGLDEAPAPLF